MIAVWTAEVKELTGDLIGEQIGRKNMATMVWPAALIVREIALNDGWTAVEIGPNAILIAKVTGLIAVWTAGAKGLTGEQIAGRITGLIATRHIEVAKVSFTPGIMPIAGQKDMSTAACAMFGGIMHAGNTVRLNV